MNLTDVRTAIETAINAATLHPSASHHDAFRAASGELSPQSPPRSYELELTVPPAPAMELAQGLGVGPDPMRVEYTLSLLYTAHDRAVWEYELQRVVRAVMELPNSSVNQTTYQGQIRNVELTGESVLGTGDPDIEADTYRIFLWRVVVFYDSRDPS